MPAYPRLPLPRPPQDGDDLDLDEKDAGGGAWTSKKVGGLSEALLLLLMRSFVTTVAGTDEIAFVAFHFIV